jgi:hypothetical protein
VHLLPTVHRTIITITTITTIIVTLQCRSNIGLKVVRPLGTVSNECGQRL